MTSRIRHAYGFGAVCAALIAGCDLDENLTVNDDDSAATLARSGGTSSSCPIWQCGFNAAEVHGASIHELNLDGLANGAGLQLLTVVPNTKAAANGFTALDVVGDEFVLRNAKGQLLVGADLIGTELVIGQNGVKLASVMIAAHDNVPRWATGAAQAHAFALTYVVDGVTERNVCTGDNMLARAAVALVLGGETYDMASKTVSPGKRRWFSIACAGSAAAKLSLLGYGPQSSATSPAQRQATLKMITADYCGNGQSYTVNGTPILWENAAGTVPLAADPEALESVWTAAGALCLDAPRIAGTQIACTLPNCGDFDLADGEWISYVPQPAAT